MDSPRVADNNYKKMKRILAILFAFMPLFTVAQIVEPVKWSGEKTEEGVHITAVIEEGFDLHITELNGVEGLWPSNPIEGYMVQFDTMLIGTEKVFLRYRSCDEWNCTFDKWEFDAQSSESSFQPVIGEDANDGNVHKWELTNEKSLLWIFVLGFLGGLLAIFTPCVWPIIPMTVSFFLKRTDKGIRNAVLYGLSIIVLYVGLGLIVTVAFGASALNDLSTKAFVNIAFFLILVLFALSFFGLFEITLPDSWSTKLDSKARSTGGFLSILFMAFTLVIVSFSCTGPIIGTLLVEAAGRSLLAPAFGMLGFAMALALPFSLFAMFPQWLKKAPKSGDWMSSFKVVLAFLELALSLKFLSVADLSYGWGILPRWLFIVIWVLCFAGIGVYLLWKIHRYSVTRIIIRVFISISSLAFAGYMMTDLWLKPVRIISAFAPPIKIDGLYMFNDYDEGLAFAKQTNKPVIVDFTGYGCVNCRKMEAYVLDDEQVKSRLQNYVFIELYVDDRRVSGDGNARGESNGDKNSRIQREQFGSNAQPYYVQLDAHGAQIAEPMAFTTSPTEFINWLQY